MCFKCLFLLPEYFASVSINNLNNLLYSIIPPSTASAYLLASPSSEIGKLEAKLLETQLDVSKIKSVQLEFVKHSKLSRELIKLEKQIETIKDKDAPKAKQVAYIFQMIRVR